MTGRVIALIPARGGSKTIPHKNIRPLLGKPLIGWTIEAARQSAWIDRIVLSTDDEAIAQVGREYGVEIVRRPGELAQDHSPMIDTIRHVLSVLGSAGELGEYRYMVLLQPTSPLRTASDIDACLRLLMDEANGYDSVATFTEAALNPHRAWAIEGHRPRVFIEGAVPWLQRQQLPAAYQLNGAVYAFKIGTLMNDPGISILVGNPGAVIMPKERSVDIDDEIDWKLAEYLLMETR